MAVILTEHYNQVFLHQIPENPLWLKSGLLDLAIIFNYFYLDTRNELDSEIDLSNIFQDLFFVGMLSGLFSVFLDVVATQLNDSALDWGVWLGNFLYHIELALVLFFLEYAFLKWKKLILQQKSRWVHFTWQIFEYLLLFSLFFHFLDKQANSFFLVYLLFIFFLFTLVLSVNLSWVAFLSFKQKIRTLAFLAAMLVFLSYFYNVISEYSHINPIDVDLSKSIFLNSLLIFTSFYAMSSALVLLFNLPTSSVFEQKFDDLINYHRVSETILEGQDAHQVYQTLLESAVETLKADAVWIELANVNEPICKNIDLDLAQDIIKAMNEKGYPNKNFYRFDKKNIRSFYPDLDYNSILLVPFFSHKEEWIASMVILKSLNNAFDNVTINLIKSYAAQAEVALDNLRLIAEAVENERFKGEMMTAKKVQKRLLPKLAIQNEQIEMLAYGFSPDLVGGDYYDFYKIDQKKYAVIIGDVSGKGTSAAFNMAQMKGIFHTLVQLDLSPDMFMKFANHALSNCLEKTSFVTATYFTFDLDRKKFYYSRAGHCPTLFYSCTDQKAYYFENKGLGLGIVRNQRYENYTSVDSFTYQAGDMMMLYTDGVVEAKNPETEEEFGYERLRNFFEKNARLSIEELTASLVKELLDFAGKNISNDDYTILTIRFL